MLPSYPGLVSSSESPEASGSKRLKEDAHQVSRLNESVYELYSPPSEPSMEVLFFHGFQHGDYKDAHRSAWKCGDGSSIWPETWLVEKFHDARILSISYNNEFIKSQGGTFDMCIIGENLTSDLLHANIGQEPCRPLVLVGHSFGGLVIKQVCTHASNTAGRLNRNSDRRFKLTALLENIQGIFFYSTPHHGIQDNRAEYFVGKGPLLQYVKSLSTDTARLNYEFDNLSGGDGQYKMWQIAGLGESRPTKLDRFHDLVVVQEASSRYGTCFNVVEEADHISVCRPMEKTSRSFSALTSFLESLATGSKAMVHGLPVHATALQRRAFVVQGKLTTSPVLGIVGMGGIGKTTLAKELFKTLSRQFEYTCFVDNVKGIKIHKLNDWLLNRFLRNGTRVGQNSLQWPDLEKKKTLIMMDDVDDEDQVRILPKLEEFGSGSRLIFTARDQGVLNTFPNCIMYEVEFLDFDEAKKLFCQHAFDQEGIPDSLIELNAHMEGNVEKVVQKCGGLPLTLEILGSYLRRHQTDNRVWKETFAKLGKAESVDGLRNDRVWSSLKVSYDALLPAEQGMFIEAGTCFFERPLEEALAAWSTAYGFSETGWANLVRTSMVKQIYKHKWDSNRPWKDIKYKEVWVHEQLRDLANNLSKGAMVARSTRDDYPLNGNEVEPTTRMLRLACNDTLNPLPLHFESLDKLEELKYLELDNFVPEGRSNNLSRKLSLLKWRNNLSKTRRSTLKYFALLKCRSVSWRARSLPTLFPIRLEDLTDLAVLELNYWELSEANFEALEKFSHLRIFSLSDIQGLTHLPENFGCLSQLKRLELRRVGLTALPHSFGNLSALEHMVVDGLEVKELPESFGNLSSLATLVISHCERLETLPVSFGNLSALQELELNNCNQLQGLPENFGQLIALQELMIDEVNNLEALPESFGLLSALQQLKFDCRKLRRLPDNFSQLSALKWLHVELAHHLEALPHSLGNLSSLEVLIIRGARRLQSLPESIGQLQSLRKLLIYAQRLKSLPDELGNLSSLEVLILSNCRRISILPDSLGRNPCLSRVMLLDCPLLDESALRSLGWVKSDKDSIDYDSVYSDWSDFPEDESDLEDLEDAKSRPGEADLQSRPHESDIGDDASSPKDLDLQDDESGPHESEESVDDGGTDESEHKQPAYGWYQRTVFPS